MRKQEKFDKITDIINELYRGKSQQLGTLCVNRTGKKTNSITYQYFTISKPNNTIRISFYYNTVILTVKINKPNGACIYEFDYSNKFTRNQENTMFDYICDVLNRFFKK